MMAEPEASSSQRQSTSSPYPLPMLHVRTPSDSQQSAYTLTVSRPPSRASYERESSIVSSSSSSLAPSDSISMHSNPLPSCSRRSRNYITPLSLSVNDLPWSDARQACFEDRLTRLTASAGFPLSWVENPEWLSFCTEFLPQAKSPSRKVLTRRLLPRVLTDFQSQAKSRASGKNATAMCDGWTGENFHHYITFMIMVGREVRLLHHS